jgi:superfamily I DNA/RNA helicase
MDDAYGGTATRVFGPPGTGKTEHLARWVRGQMPLHGPDSTTIVSFSTTAAQAIAERFENDAIRPNPRKVGTLHAQARKAIGGGLVAQDPEVLRDWNSSVTPEMRITPDKRRDGTNAPSAAPNDAATGDDLLAALDMLRSTLIDPQDWPVRVRQFADRWTAWKNDAGAVDFCDMLCQAYQRALDGEHAPGRPKFLVSDESQDMTPLEIKLILQWGLHVEQLILGMDDDQAINGWRGGTPDPLLRLHGDQVTDVVLDQSYRVPEAVRLAAERWIRRVKFRRDKQYKARMQDGQVVVGSLFTVPEDLDDPRLIDRVTRDLDTGDDVMIIATCNYLLTQLISNLRTAGIPFHNPYRPTENLWNPFGTTTDIDSLSTARRIYHYLSLEDRDWTADDIKAWLELIKIRGARSASMVANAKTIVRGWPSGPVPDQDVMALFTDPDQLDRALGPDSEWLSAHLLQSKKDAAAYPLQVVREHGYQALADTPRVVVGTIHSVKGAGADIVYVAPDISGAAARNLNDPGGKDEMRRQFYVAMTRARKSLRVLAPKRGQHISGLVPPELETIA